MAKLYFKLADKSAEFGNGFRAAMDFMDGVESLKSMQVLASNLAGVTVTMEHDAPADSPVHDNCTYRIDRNRVVFDSLGVEE